MTVVTDANFDAMVLKAQKPVVVLYQARWCGPCRMVVPSVSSLQSELKGQVLLATLDVDANPKTPAKFNVSSIPALLIFKKGKLVARQIGAAPQEKISSWVRQSVSAAN